MQIFYPQTNEEYIFVEKQILKRTKRKNLLMMLVNQIKVLMLLSCNVTSIVVVCK